MLFSSHHLPDVEKVCDRVIIIDRGRIRFDDKLSTIRAQGPDPGGRGPRAAADEVHDFLQAPAGRDGRPPGRVRRRGGDVRGPDRPRQGPAGAAGQEARSRRGTASAGWSCGGRSSKTRSCGWCSRGDKRAATVKGAAVGRRPLPDGRGSCGAIMSQTATEHPPEFAPSDVRAEAPTLARHRRVIGLFALTVGVVSVIAAQYGRGIVGEGFGYLMAAVGVVGLFVHAARDSDLEVRRLYGALAAALLIAAVVIGGRSRTSRPAAATARSARAALRGRAGPAEPAVLRPVRPPRDRGAVPHLVPVRPARGRRRSSPSARWSPASSCRSSSSAPG